MALIDRSCWRNVAAVITLGKSTVAYWGCSNEGAVRQAAGIDGDLVRLQSDAKRAFESF